MSLAIHSDKTVTEFFFTLNNYTDDHEQYLQGLNAQFVIYGREVAPTTGTKHLQGVVQFAKPRRMGPILRHLAGIHVERLLDPTAAIEYCRKEGDFYESGEYIPSRRGKRTDLEELRTKISKEGATVRRLLDEHPLNYQQLKYAETLQKYVPPPEIERTIKWFWGPTGAGKSSSAMELLKTHGADIAVLGGNLNFMNGYDGHTLVLIDDFRPKNIDFDTFLRLLDRYPVTCNVKGTTSPWRAQHIYITAPQHPAHMWYKTDAAQVLRRILQSPDGEIIHVQPKVDSRDWVEIADEMAHEAARLMG